MVIEHIPNIRDLPWIDDEQLTHLAEQEPHGSPIKLPALEVVLGQAALTFSKAKNIEGDEWRNDGAFLQDSRAKEFLQTLMTACHLVKAHEAHTDIYCGWQTANGVCGSLMDIEADSIRAYYRCKKDRNHRTAIP
jgi:hypothetical protein